MSKHFLCNILFRTLVDSFKQITVIIHVLLVFAILVYKCYAVLLLLLLLLQVCREMAVVVGASRDVIQMVLLMTVLVCGLTAASSECPRGCICDTDKGTVQCIGISSCPTELPAATKEIKIIGSYLKEIPSGAFDNLQQLESIAFTNTTIGAIRRRAFYRIGRDIHNKELVFSEVTIKNIEQEAFEELEDFKSIIIYSAKLFNVSSGAFSKLRNIGDIFLSWVTVSTLRSNTFTTFSHVSSVGIATSTIDLIEEEAFSKFSDVEKFALVMVTVGTLGSRFVTLSATETLNIVQSTFGLWQECSFCGVRATSVTIFRNTVNGTEGNVFKGISGVKSLNIVGNSLPFVVARFLPIDLPKWAMIAFSYNDLTTIRCGGLGTDYPTNIIYSITNNEVTCDCRLNWMWKKWSKTCAAQRLTPGFVCAGPERQSLSDYFSKVSASEITPPCDGVEPVNDCTANTTVSACAPVTDGAGTISEFESQTTSEMEYEVAARYSAAAATNKASGLSILAVILLTLMAS